MKYYTSTTEFNCGIDLHAHQMYVCLMDRQGKKLARCNVKDNDWDYFLKLVQPYRHDLTICAECMFGWYWLADACQAEGLTFVLAHALYLHLIHGGKNKNDRIDSEKIAHLLRSNLIPPSYVYPAARRPLRALLRQRLTYVWRRSELLARIYSHQLAHNRTPAKQTRRCREFTLLKTIPGIGEALGLTILYEIGDIARFPSVKDSLSYCRLVKGTVASPGKIKGLRGPKLGNPYLRWAFGEAAVFAFEWIASGLTDVGFWTAPGASRQLRPEILALECPVWSGLAPNCTLARLSPNRCLAGLRCRNPWPGLWPGQLLPRTQS